MSSLKDCKAIPVLNVVVDQNRVTKSNFTNFEKEFITELVMKYAPILESRRNDASMCREKNATWEILTEEFNNFDPKITKRTAKQLKKCWENLKTRAKKASYGLKPDQPYTDETGTCETIVDNQPQVADLIAMQLKPLKGGKNMAVESVEKSIDVEDDEPLVEQEEEMGVDEKTLNTTPPSSDALSPENMNNQSSASLSPPTSLNPQPIKFAKTHHMISPTAMQHLPKNPLIRQSLSWNFQSQQLVEEEQRLKVQLLKRKLEIAEEEHYATMALIESKREYVELKKRRLLQDGSRVIDSD